MLKDYKYKIPVEDGLSIDGILPYLVDYDDLNIINDVTNSFGSENSSFDRTLLGIFNDTLYKLKKCL